MNSPVRQLAVLVVDRLLEEHLAQRMRDSALYLPLDEQRIDHRAAIVHGDVTS